MYTATAKYKKAMLKPLRGRSYVSVGVGIVNQEAQEDATITGELMPYSIIAPVFANTEIPGIYAQMEQNLIKLDGNLLFMPAYDQYIKTGITSKNILGSITIKLGATYNIKGLTVNFTENYPTSFNIIAGGETYAYTNNKAEFTTNEVFGEVDNIVIKPLQMVNGNNKRLRITKITFGVGLSYVASEIDNLKITETNNGISAEVPTKTITLTISDYAYNYNVDDQNSFVNFLETGQNVTVSIGQKLEDNTIEWIPTATGRLTNWASKPGKMSFTAKDIFNFMSDTYSASNKIYTRTAYDEAKNILRSFGLLPDQYQIDECLRNVTLINPMPAAPYKECLQLLCNACRCIMYEDEKGVLVIKANFATVLDPEDITTTEENAAAWANGHNVLIGAQTFYADLSKDYLQLNGSFNFIPENGNYANTTGFITGLAADINGEFEEAPKLTLEFEAAYNYYGIYVEFDGTPPEQIAIYTYNAEELIDYVEFSDMEQINYFTYTFEPFDKMEIEIQKAPAGTRTHVKKISFGNLTDYEITKQQMTAAPVGIADKKIKNVNVKIYTFANDSDGKAQEVENEVYYTQELNATGEDRTLKNPLISSEEHAAKVGAWLANYYENNLSYSVDFRGEPRLHAADLINIETDAITNLQTEIEETTLTYNGALKGSLELRKAVNMVVSYD